MHRLTGNHHNDSRTRDYIEKLETESRRDSPGDFGREAASACVAACFDELIPSVEEACRQLQYPGYAQQKRLWDLYCCDSLNCGVYIGAVGQSPNVDLIINECQNIGFASIEDPGPPKASYCASSSSPLRPLEIKPSSFPAVVTRSTQSKAPQTSTALTTATSTTTTTGTSRFIAPLATPSTSPSGVNSTDTASDELSGGAKAAIGVFSVLAALAVATILFVLIIHHRRRKNQRRPPPLFIPFDNDSYCDPGSGPHAPLIATPPPTSSRNTPLTPPAKLSDRRFLHPAFHNGTTRSSAPSNLGNASKPSSNGPTHSKLASQHQHQRQAAASDIGLPIGTATAGTSHCSQSSLYSVSTGPGTMTKPISIRSGSVTIMGTGTPPLSPTIKTARAHDVSTEPSGPAMPAGPPPKRALPAPPPNHPNSPVFSPSPVSPLSPTFPPRTVAKGDYRSTAPQPSVSTQELCDLTESYAREPRGSWGSWSGVGGGGPGVNHTGRQRGSGSPRSSAQKKAESTTHVPLKELDLEMLSGRY
ncbi:hypothetical protein GGS20DRAFT_588442 [Poronia punctata]|nr:hypothetical protein GGS20DRAFT_588442 [Poronia punctata]